MKRERKRAEKGSVLFSKNEDFRKVSGRTPGEFIRYVEPKTKLTANNAYLLRIERKKIRE